MYRCSLSCQLGWDQPYSCHTDQYSFVPYPSLVGGKFSPALDGIAPYPSPSNAPRVCPRSGARRYHASPQLFGWSKWMRSPGDWTTTVSGQYQNSNAEPTNSSSYPHNTTAAGRCAPRGNRPALEMSGIDPNAEQQPPKVEVVEVDVEVEVVPVTFPLNSLDWADGV